MEAKSLLVEILFGNDMASIIWRVTKETKTPGRVASFKTKSKHKRVMSFIFQIFHELHSTVPVSQGRLQRSRSQRTPSYLFHLQIHESGKKDWVMLSISSRGSHRFLDKKFQQFFQAFLERIISFSRLKVSK